MLIASIGACSALERLHLSYLAVGTSLAPLASLENLAHLTLTELPSKVSLAPLAPLPKLTHVTVSVRCTVERSEMCDLFRPLVRFVALTHLTIPNLYSDDDAAAPLAFTNPRVTVFQTMANLRPSGFAHIADAMPNLTALAWASVCLCQGAGFG